MTSERNPLAFMGTMQSFEDWYTTLEMLASDHGVSVADADAWRESYEQGADPWSALLDEYPDLEADESDDASRWDVHAVEAAIEMFSPDLTEIKPSFPHSRRSQSQNGRATATQSPARCWQRVCWSVGPCTGTISARYAPAPCSTGSPSFITDGSKPRTVESSIQPAGFSWGLRRTSMRPRHPAPTTTKAATCGCCRGNDPHLNTIPAATRLRCRQRSVRLLPASCRGSRCRVVSRRWRHTGSQPSR